MRPYRVETVRVLFTKEPSWVGCTQRDESKNLRTRPPTKQVERGLKKDHIVYGHTTLNAPDLV